MDVEGICLSLIDHLTLQVEQKLNGVEENLSHHLNNNAYNLHPFNDLYPHYSLTQEVREIQVERPPIPFEIGTKATTKQNENVVKLDKVLANSEKLIEYSEKVMARLENLEKNLLSMQLEMLSSNGHFAFGREGEFGERASYSIAKPPLTMIENIPNEGATRQVQIQFAQVKMKQEEFSDEENKPTAPKRAKLRVGLSKRRIKRKE